MRVTPPATGTYTAITATTTINTGTGCLLGFLITSATTGTIAITDGVTTIMPASPSLTIAVPQFIPLPANYNTNLVFTITGTAQVTVIWAN